MDVTQGRWTGRMQARRLSSADRCKGLRRVIPRCATRWRHETHRALRERGDGQAGIHTEVGSQHRTIANVHVVIPEDAMLAVNHSSVWRICHDASSNAVRRPRHIEEDFGQHAHGRATRNLGEFGRKLVCLWNIGSNPLAVTREHLPKWPEPVPLPAHFYLSLHRLHAQKNSRLPRPAPQPEKTQSSNRMESKR